MNPHPVHVASVLGTLVLWPLGLLASPAVGPEHMASQCFADFVTQCVSETGGFPPSNPGDEFEVLSLVDLSPPLTWDPVNFEYTVRLGDLVSEGQSQQGPYQIAVAYSGGTLVIYEDPRSGGTPAVRCDDPESFADGTPYLVGEVTSFSLFFNSQFNSGAADGRVTFTGGTHLHELGGNTSDVVLGGIFVFSGPGFPLQWDGQVCFAAVPVEPTTWGQVKSTFR